MPGGAALASLLLKGVLTVAVICLIAGGSYVITSQPPPPLTSSVFVSTLETVLPSCNRTDCSGYGECEIESALNASAYRCTCDDLYYGPVCEMSCPLLCSGLGSCLYTNDTTNVSSLSVDKDGNVTCQCPRYRAGLGCEEDCPFNCSNQGVCHTNATCECDKGFTGPTCEVSCNGTCGNGVCDMSGFCRCDAGLYGSECTSAVRSCGTDILPNVAYDTTQGPYEETFRFPPGCANDSFYTVTLDIAGYNADCVRVLLWVNAVQFVTLDSYGAPGLVTSATGSLGVISFPVENCCASQGFVSFRPVTSFGLPQYVSFNISCAAKGFSGPGCPGSICDESPKDPKEPPPLDSTLRNSNPYVFPTEPSFDQNAWTPALPHLNTLQSGSYFRPDVLSTDASNQFAVGLGWLTIVVAILCCITFVGFCVRPLTIKVPPVALTNTDSFFRVWVHEVRIRHAIVGLCSHSAESLWDIPAKFLLLFLNTFLNLAFAALWLGQHSVGEMVSSTLITAVSVFVIMQSVRLCLKGAHLGHQWYVVVISYIGPLALAVWSAYTTGLYILSMTEMEAHFFLIRAVCSFVLQHTLFIGTTTAVMVVVQRSKSNKTAPIQL